MAAGGGQSKHHGQDQERSDGLSDHNYPFCRRRGRLSCKFLIHYHRRCGNVKKDTKTSQTGQVPAYLQVLFYRQCKVW